MNITSTNPNAPLLVFRSRGTKKAVVDAVTDFFSYWPNLILCAIVLCSYLLRKRRARALAVYGTKRLELVSTKFDRIRSVVGRAGRVIKGMTIALFTFDILDLLSDILKLYDEDAFKANCERMLPDYADIKDWQTTAVSSVTIEQAATLAAVEQLSSGPGEFTLAFAEAAVRNYPDVIKVRINPKSKLFKNSLAFTNDAIDNGIGAVVHASLTTLLCARVNLKKLGSAIRTIIATVEAL